MSKREKVRRVSRDFVRSNASEGGGKKVLRMPAGVRELMITEKKTAILNFVPYTTTSEAHPDTVEAGVLWYKHPFFVHRGVGPASVDIVCPTSIGQPCPMCERRKKLTQNWDDNETKIRALSYQKHTAYIVIDPEDEDKFAIYAPSYGKFGKQLDLEMAELPEDDAKLNFWDVTDEGQTLTVRYSKIEFTGGDGKKGNYIGASKIEFAGRDAMDEAATLAAVPNLDSIIAASVLPYDKIKSMFAGTAPPEADPDDDGAADEGDDDDAPAAKAPKKKPAAPDPEDDDDDDDDDDDKPAPKPAAASDPEEEATIAVGDAVTFVNKKGKTIKGTVKEIDGDDVIVENDDDDFDVDIDDLTLVMDAPAAKAPKKKPAAPDPEDDDDDDDDKPAPKPGKKPAAAPAPDPDDDDDDEPAVVEKAKFKIGDEVEWDEGDETGSIVKMHSDGTKARIKDSDGQLSWQPIADLSKAGK